MAGYSEDAIQRGAFGSVLGAVGSNQSLDLEKDLGLELPSDPGLDLARQLLQTHPTYGGEVRKWIKYLDLYESHDIYRFIFRHLRETDASWKKRIERGYFNNYLKSVVDLYTCYIFSSPVERQITGLDKIFNDRFYKNVDFRGTNYKSFLMDVCTFTQVEGHVGILVDAPSVDDESLLSERDRIRGNIRPYLTLLHPHQILDWELDAFGRFEWVKICLAKDVAREWTVADPGDAKAIIIWSKDKFEVYTVTGREGQEVAKLEKEGINKLGEVPLIISKFRKQARHQWFGVSSVNDIADINIGILNWSSLGDEEIYERCLNVLAMQKGGDGSSPDLTHHNVLEYDSEKPPEYLTPGATPLKLIKEWIEFHIGDILRLAKLKGPTGMADVRQAQSGIAYAFEFNETNQTLSNRAESIETVDFEIHRLVALYFDEEFDGTVAYPKEFGVEDLLTELNALTIGRAALTSETAIKELEKRTVRRAFAKSATELRAKMEKEIEEGEAKPTFESMIGTQPEENAFSNQEEEYEEKAAPDEESGKNDNSESKAEE